MKIEWKDTTNYSRDDKERIPTAFAATLGDLRIVVTSGHIYYRGQWIMHCFKVGVDTLPLNVVSLEEAKNKALEIVKSKITKWYNYFQETK